MVCHTGGVAAAFGPHGREVVGSETFLVVALCVKEEDEQEDGRRERIGV